MPYRDKRGHTCGFLDLEEKENSGHFVRRYFLLDMERKTLEYFMDNPQNLPPGNKPNGSFNMQYVSMISDASKSRSKLPFCFYVTVGGKRHYMKANDQKDQDDWIEALQNAAKITVTKSSSDSVDGDAEESIQGSYNVEIVAGVPHKIHIECDSDSDMGSSADELEREFTSVKRPFTHQEPIKLGYCVKRGAVIKSWRRRYFVLDEEGISYYKSCESRAPIRTINRAEIVEARISIGIHVNRDHVFEIVTAQRVFYVQAENETERDAWMSEINGVLQMSKKPKRQELEMESPDHRPALLQSKSLPSSIEGADNEVTRKSYTVWL